MEGVTNSLDEFDTRIGVEEHPLVHACIRRARSNSNRLFAIHLALSSHINEYGQ